ncbi:MAG: hypothetical protein HY287_08765 [Planctomycetes bacterium]|nr:hypothetical protein [Planctomycetota bacterium]MBI3834405.1 hypothetical protein [Planctomycetota bacterium]
MGTTLEELRRLQTVELQLVTIRQNREGKLRRVELLKRQIKQIDDRLAAHHTAAREKQMRLDALQLDVSAREDSISKHRQALNKAKTNKEYGLILTAMNTEQADNAKIETSMLQMMEEIQAFKDEGVAIDAEKKKSLDDLAIAEKALAALDAETKARFDALKAERDGIAAHVSPDALTAFERAAQRHDGEALAAVTRPRPKNEEYMCSGCNMTLPLDLYNALRTKNDVVLCKTCGRILFAEIQASASTAGRRSR